MNLFFQYTIDGLTLGGIFALVALGFTIVYGVLRLLNFAHGILVVVGMYVGVFTLEALGGPSASSAVLPAIIAGMFLAAMLACGAGGFLIERVVYRPLRQTSYFGPVLAGLGTIYVVQYSIVLLFGSTLRSYNSYYFAGGAYLLKGLHFGQVYLSYMAILTLALALAIMCALTLLVHRTTLGRAMRAVASDSEAAAMMGINSNRVIAWAFFISGVLAGAAGVMQGLLFGDFDSTTGIQLGLIAFVASVLGGIGSIPGAMVGGFAIGLVRSYAVGYLPYGDLLRDPWVFLLLVLVLLVRPAGLLGRQRLEKV